MTAAIEIVHEDDGASEQDAGRVAMLVELVAATPPPPDGEPDGLLAAFDAMVAARAAVLARLQAATGEAAIPGGLALLEELARRDEAWISALVRAQDVVADRLRAVRRAQRAGR